MHFLKSSNKKFDINSLEKFADDITAYPYGLNFTSDELITINKLDITECSWCDKEIKSISFSFVLFYNNGYEKCEEIYFNNYFIFSINGRSFSILYF